MESLKIRFIQTNDNNENNKYMLNVQFNDHQTFSIKKMIVFSALWVIQSLLQLFNFAIVAKHWPEPRQK